MECIITFCQIYCNVNFTIYAVQQFVLAETIYHVTASIGDLMVAN